jgi:hypothetical protein
MFLPSLRDFFSLLMSFAADESPAYFLGVLAGLQILRLNVGFGSTACLQRSTPEHFSH